MDASFIIPVYNQLELTRACLESLRETIKDLGTFEILIVDDASEAQIAEGLQALAGGNIKVIRNPVNLGYAHSNNQGAYRAQGKLLFFLNNDLELLPDWLPPMLDAFRKIPKLGLVGNVQRRFSDNSIDHCGAYIGLDATIQHHKRLPKGLFGTPAYSRHNLITGACCAMRKDLFLSMGGFDEAFVNGCEEIDLCFRLRQRGYPIVVANHSVVRHHVSATREATSLNQERNFRLLQRRWKTRLAPMAASRWPDHYLAQVRQNRALADYSKLAAALPRFLTLKKGPAPVAIELAMIEMDRKERHWKSILDGYSDEMIKQEERKAHSNLLADQYKLERLYSDDCACDGVWIREDALITLPPGLLATEIEIRGEVSPEDPHHPEEKGQLGLKLTVNGLASRALSSIEPGSFRIAFENPPNRASSPLNIQLKLLGTGRSNTLAYLGRVWRNLFLLPPAFRRFLARYRAQRLNKRLGIQSLLVNGEEVFDFKRDATSPLNMDYVLRHADMGMNLVGWFKAELGIGESARLAAKALQASGLPHNLVPLKVNCLASQGDSSLDDRLTDRNPYPVNVFHIDAPQCGDIDHHHGDAFRRGKHNIAYWAWELPEFPDRWGKYFKYFDEIWTPSNFVRDAIVMKSPVPVISIPHCIDFELPEMDYRAALDLPKDKFLFSFAYDLNSYQERKNPKAAIEAFKRAFLGTDRENDVGLVIKTHSSQKNPEAFQELLSLLQGIPNFYLIDKTLPRQMVYGLMQASDAYVSLHRSEGFGLTVAESMFLGKPVISTNWSATTEFVNPGNGCPVNYQLVELQKTFGPYQKGQIWADPDPQHAAEHMYRIANDSELAHNLGYNARATVKELFSPARIGDLYKRRLRAITLW